MSDAFDHLIPDAQDFCRRLAENNTRDWYQEHKDEYAQRLKAPAELLLEQLRPGLAAMTGGSCTTKLFRINRDLRFAKGKPPYKDYLHMLWYAPAEDVAPLGWFFGIEKTRVRVGAGYMSFDGAALTAWREVIAGDEGAAIAQAIEAELEAGAEMREPPLKRVPAPYDRDHPRGHLLRRKGMALFRDIEPPQEDLGSALMQEFRRFWPVFKPIHAAMSPA